MSLSLHLEQRSGIPLHHQISEQLRQRIGAGSYRVGEKLPAESVLARSLGVSRNTVRQAIAPLVADGLVTRRAGDGTRVSPPRTTEVGLGRWSSFSGDMAAKGIAVETFSERIEAVRCTAVIAGALGVEEGTQVVLLDRVRGYDGEPAVWFRSWFHPRLGLDERSTFDGPLYEYLERVAGVVATSSREELGAAACDERTAGRLNSAVGVPVMVRRRTVTDRSGRPIEYADNRYRSDRFTYTLEMQRMGVGG